MAAKAVDGTRPGGRSARVVAAVRQAVTDLLMADGFEALTIGLVAQRAGVHESSIYRRWGTREYLVLDTLLSSIETAVPIPDTGSFRTDLRALLQGLVDRLATPLGETMLRLAVSARATFAESKTLEEYWSSQRRRAAPMLERALARGEIRTTHDGELITELAFGSVYLRVLVTGDPVGAAFLDSVVDLLFPSPGH